MSRITYVTNRIIDSDGISDGATVYVYQSGTTTTVSLFSDSDMLVPMANPFTVAAGAVFPDVYHNHNGSIRLYIVSSSGAIDDTDPYSLFDADEMTFDPGRSNDVARSVTARLRDEIHAGDFGVIADGSTNNDTAWANAVAAAKAENAVLVLPEGIIRLTTGITNSTNFTDIHIRGQGRATYADTIGTIIQLDNTDPASFFYNSAGIWCGLYVSDCTFSCAQEVQDRAFFRWTTNYHWFVFERVSFINVEKPLCFEAGSYFQSSALRDVQFRDSGTIHAEEGTSGGWPNNLRGTGLILDNVHHEGTIPENTDKVVCDLSAIRNIYADGLILEGGLPSTGWTVLKLTNPYNLDYTRYPFAHINGYHCEWTSNQPTYAVDQQGGTAIFHHIQGLDTSGTVTGKYRVGNSGKAIIRDTSFMFTSNEPSTFFEREDSTCLVVFEDCGMRTMDLTNRGFIHDNCQVLSATDGLGQCLVSNTASVALWQFDGGIVATGGDLFITATGSYSSTDATYGRKLVIPGTATLDSFIRTKTKDFIEEGDQVWVAAKIKLPTFTGGSVLIGIGSNTTTTLNSTTYTSTSSNTIVDVIMPYTRKAADAFTSYGIRIFQNGLTGLSGDVEIYALAIGYGRSLPQFLLAHYPRNIVTFGSAAPTLGSWTQGDVVWNTATAAAGSPGWVCTTTGTPGTWKAMAAVAA